jgi:hypothetical protein
LFYFISFQILSRQKSVCMTEWISNNLNIVYRQKMKILSCYEKNIVYYIKAISNTMYSTNKYFSTVSCGTWQQNTILLRLQHFYMHLMDSYTWFIFTLVSNGSCKRQAIYIMPSVDYLKTISNFIFYVRFKVITEVIIQIKFSLIDRYGSLGRACYLHIRSWPWSWARHISTKYLYVFNMLSGITFQHTAISNILVTVRTFFKCKKKQAYLIAIR